jgi:Zn-dependent protease with chaperone function
MIRLPEWDSQFVAKSKWYTLIMNLYESGRAFIVLIIPWGLAVLRITPGMYHLYTIILFFCILCVLFTLEQAVWAVKRRNQRRMVFRLFETLPELVLLCISCMLWWLFFPGNILQAIAIWWLMGIALVLIRYASRRWALNEATLQTKDYRLFGRRLGRFSKRKKHDKASLLQLADKSAFARYTIMTLISDNPEIYASGEARRLLDADQFRVIVAHELGHSCSTYYVGYELADWIRKIFLVPLLASATTSVWANVPLAIGSSQVFIFLTAMTLIRQINNWLSMFLNRKRELGADLYGVEVTRTPVAFIEAMTKLAEVGIYNVFPNIFDTLALCSHPCTVKRLEHIANALDEPSKYSHRRRECLHQSN